ncbi:hypothetical protein PGT21_036350 [Puccinia graminis f. sp. tritici]|uniref:Uncharacterized protein n=1 Tax=Puccinia graminis f. sp. tritici TaxID=56615 RepID=A0A5B0PBR2_PUCGR|nr:hypothetical protein PGT21_036350 [Puccinia graminis f. sp. tritici]KAA1100383.1 hypothetical protein PGTUg99_024778 [Puccinia graminis f. sp. tritici]
MQHHQQSVTFHFVVAGGRALVALATGQRLADDRLHNQAQPAERHPSLDTYSRFYLTKRRLSGLKSLHKLSICSQQSRPCFFFLPI